MPVTCKKRGDKWRVVEAATGTITTNTEELPLMVVVIPPVVPVWLSLQLSMLLKMLTE